MKTQSRTEVPSGHMAKPLPGQRALLPEDESDASGTQQVTIRVDAQAVRVLQQFGEVHGIKRNRLFDEAIQAYAGLLAAGLRVSK